jgi:phosphoadenosine phosphosulfate reductase
MIQAVSTQADGTDYAISSRPKWEEASVLVRENIEHSEGQICVTSSFQAEDVIVLHMVRSLLSDVAVIFLDTGYHFAETYTYRDRIVREWSLNLINLLPETTVEQQESVFGKLYQSEPSRCCGMRKVRPLFSALERYALWFTGLRREQAKSRAALQQVEPFALPGGKQIRKVSPLAEWSTRDVWEYASHHGIPLLPLYEQGYSSIGCEPCTSQPADPNDPRSGRWGGKKQECGIHIQAQ